jgi:hypothetical protein
MNNLMYPLRESPSMICGRFVLMAVITFVFSGSLSAASSTVADAVITLGYDNNQANAAAASDREEGFIVGVGGSVRQRNLLTNGVGLQFTGDLSVKANERFGDLSHLEGGIEASLHFKPVPGFDKPFYSLMSRVSTQVFNGSRIRNSLFVNAGASAGIRLTHNAIGRIGYGFEWREAFSSEVFDTSAHRLFANVDYKLARNWSVYASYDLRMGDTVSTATPSTAALVAADKFKQDDAFGVSSTAGNLLGLSPLGPLGLLGNNRQRFAYRLNSTAHTGRVGLNYRLSRTMGLDVSAQYRKTLGNNDLDYQAMSLNGAFSYRF